IVRRSRLIACALPVAYIAFQFVWRSRVPGIVPPFLIVALLGHLMGYGIARTTLGTLRPEPGFPGVAGALAIALFAGAVILAWRRGTTHGRRWVFACLLLALAAYFMVAVGRAYWYSQNPGLVGNADRYQYVGPPLITVSWCGVVGGLGAAR